MNENRWVKLKKPKTPYEPARYGVSFKGMTRQQKRLLIEHPILKNRAQDFQFLQIIFKTCYKGPRKKRVYYDTTINDFVSKNELIENYDTIDWHCALSGEMIKCNINDFSLENFVHPDHRDALNKAVIDTRILKSSIEFRKHVKKLLLEQQKELLDLAKKNSKKLK